MKNEIRASSRSAASAALTLRRNICDVANFSAIFKAPLLRRSFAALCCAAALSGCATSIPGQAAKQKDLTLQDAVAQVNDALKTYQDSTPANSLAPLQSAILDFKTVTATSGGGSLTILIFKAGASYERDFTADMTYEYDNFPPPATSSPRFVAGDTPNLTKDLLAAITAAAQSNAANYKVGALTLNKTTVTISFAVKEDGNGGLTFVSLPVSLNADRNQTATHSITLVFGNPPPAH